MQAMRKLGIISAITSLLVLINPGSVWADTLIKEAGTLNETTDSRLEDGSLYDAFEFSGSSGQQVTIVLESREFDPYLILVDPNGERINENDDISRNNLNSRLVLVLPSTGTYTVYANSYDATKSGEYNITVRTNEQTVVSTNFAALLFAPSVQCSNTVSTVLQSLEADRDMQALPSIFQLISRYESVPKGKPDGVEISLSGTATQSVMASSQLIKYAASRLIQSCTSVGAVAFSPEAYQEERLFGYSPTRAFNAPAANPVEEFNCAITVAPSEFEQRPPWGQKRCL